MAVSKGNQIDMLNGNPTRAMFAFALPLIATGMLQQSFNSVDIAVAGRFAGHGALAAVGCNGPVIGLIINLFLGLAIGVNVVIATYIGQRNPERVRRTVGAAMILSVICGIFMLAVALTVAKPIHRLLGTPEEVMDQAVAYLRIMALGMPFMIVYNFGAAVLRSIGDTKRPFYILVTTGIINVGLNLFFVIGMGMGVEGVAWGTVISTVINAVAIVVILLYRGGDVTLYPALLRPFRHETARICRIGIPAGIQTTVFAFSNVFILSAINSFGAVAAAGSAAAINFEFYTYFVISAFAQTATAFTGQNFGAQQIGRIRIIMRKSLKMALIATTILASIILWQHRLFLSIFTTDAGVQDFGAIRVCVVLGTQIIACYYECAGGVMRGMGHSMTPAVITIAGTCLLRLLWVGFVPYQGNFGALMSVYPISWILTDIMMWIAMRRIVRHLPGWHSKPELAD